MRRQHQVSALILLISASTAHSEIVVTQPDKLSGGVSGYDGKVIQIQIDFRKPLPPTSEFSIYSGNVKFLDVKNESESQLERFVTRFRMKINEELNILVKYPDQNYNYKFKPTISKDFELPSLDVYNPSIKALKVESSQMKESFGSIPGDCLFLATNVSMTGDKFMRSALAAQAVGNIKITATDRISTNPLFGIGATPQAKKCELKIEG